jgi:hypothetical protein
MREVEVKYNYKIPHIINSTHRNIYLGLNLQKLYTDFICLFSLRFNQVPKP